MAEKNKETTTHQARITKFTYYYDGKQIKQFFLKHIFYFN